MKIKAHVWKEFKKGTSKAQVFFPLIFLFEQTFKYKGVKPLFFRGV